MKKTIKKNENSRLTRRELSEKNITLRLDMEFMIRINIRLNSSNSMKNS